MRLARFTYRSGLILEKVLREDSSEKDVPIGSAFQNTRYPERERNKRKLFLSEETEMLRDFHETSKDTFKIRLEVLQSATPAGPERQVAKTREG